MPIAVAVLVMLTVALAWRVACLPPTPNAPKLPTSTIFPKQ